MSGQKDDIIDFSWVLEYLLYPVILIRYYIKLILIYLLMAVLLAFILKLVLPEKYEAKFVVKVNERNDLNFINMLYDLSQLSKEHDYTAISRELKLEEHCVKSLSKFEYIPLFTSGSRDSCIAFVAELQLSDTACFIPIQNAMLNYLETAPYYEILKQKKQNNLQQMAIKLKHDMLETDSVNNIIINNIKPPQVGVNGMVYNVPLNPYEAYERNMNRFREQLWLTDQMKYTSNFELIKRCVVSNKPAWPKLTFLLRILLPLAFIISFFHAHAIHIKTSLNV